MNEEIDAPQVRLIDENGEQLGVRPVAEAIAYADEHELDLVEVAAAASPPVCRVMDYGKWRYEEERKARESRRNQVHVSYKEVRLRPKIGSHDFAWKREQAAEFLRGRSKVRLVVLFRGREREHPELATALLDRLASEVAEFGQAEGKAVFEGRSMSMILAPR